MGYIIKNTVTRPCRMDTLAQVRDPDRVRELIQQDMIVKRRGIGILVYLESDFSDFYAKHVRRQLARPDTVLVKNLTQIPSPSEARTIVEHAIRTAVIGPTKVLESPVPQLPGAQYDVRVWNPAKRNFIDQAPIKKQVFRLRDLLMPHSYKSLNSTLQGLKGSIPRNEAQSLLTMYQETFQKEVVQDPKTHELRYEPKMEYTIDYIWIIQKIILYRFDWHG